MAAVLETHRIDKAIKDAIRSQIGGATVRDIHDCISLCSVDAVSVDVIKRHLRSLHLCGEVVRESTVRDDRPVFCWKIPIRS